MTTRDDVNRLSTASKRLVQMARNDLASLFVGLDLSNPEAVRAALLEVTPALVTEYGDLAATAAADWYEELRDNVNPRQRYTVQTVPAAAESEVQGSVRWAAKDLFGDDPANTLRLLQGSIQRHILYSARATIARNAEHDPSNPRFARVPTGAKTCAFCEIMASRGFVYRTEDLAGGGGHYYHDDCDCQIVPEWDKTEAHISGYDPDAMYDRYLEAWDKAGGRGVQAGDVAKVLRRMYPDQYTDGIKPII